MYLYSVEKAIYSVSIIMWPEGTDCVLCVATNQNLSKLHTQASTCSIYYISQSYRLTMQNRFYYLFIIVTNKLFGWDQFINFSFLLNEI